VNHTLAEPFHSGTILYPAGIYELLTPRFVIEQPDRPFGVKLELFDTLNLLFRVRDDVKLVLIGFGRGDQNKLG
jgi:hypothetical protein